MMKRTEAEPLQESCWWCGDNWPTDIANCSNCGNSMRIKPKIDWDHIEEVFPDGVPSCGLTDAVRLGASDAEVPAFGTIYLNR